MLHITLLLVSLGVTTAKHNPFWCLYNKQYLSTLTHHYGQHRPGTFAAGARYGPDLPKCSWTDSPGNKEAAYELGCQHSPSRLCA